MKNEKKKKEKKEGIVNGQEIKMSLIEAGANENHDDFELYLKG